METLRAPKGAVKQRKRLGRGNGSGNGTTAGKGTKGQNSRSGGGVRPGFEGGQMPLYRRVARRGFSNYPFKKEFVTVSLESVNKAFKSGETVDLETLRERRLIGNRDTLVKILGDGEATKKLNVKGVVVSRSAAAKITGAGGTVDTVAGGGIAEAPMGEKAPAEDKAPAEETPKAKAEAPAEKKAPAKEKAPAEDTPKPKAEAPAKKKAAAKESAPAKDKPSAESKSKAKAPEDADTPKAENETKADSDNKSDEAAAEKDSK